MRLLLFVGLWLSAASAMALPVYSTVYVFGDSLSDSGNVFQVSGGTVPDPVYYDQGRFSNGPNYADRLWTSLGLAGNLAPRVYAPVAPQGTNYAFGGARSRYTTADLQAGTDLPPALGNTPTTGSLLNQVAFYQGDVSGLADPEALHVFWFGGNDAADVLNVFGLLGSVQADAYLAQAVSDATAALNALVGIGVRKLLVIDAPDIGLTPRVRELDATNPGTAAVATAIASAYNAGIEQALQGLASVPDLDIIQFSSFDLMQEIVADPGAAGFTNAEAPCLVNFFVLPPPTGPVSECGNPQDYLFWDEFHLSAAGHQVLEQGILAAIPVPGPVFLMVPALLGLLRLRKQGSRLDS